MKIINITIKQLNQFLDYLTIHQIIKELHQKKWQDLKRKKMHIKGKKKNNKEIMI